ncbi:MAG: glycosyltransferase family 2 protein [Bacteroidetes bacterium]|nr:glycosyltransferase family 2 protein [Bacteroidota bacterium]
MISLAITSYNRDHMTHNSFKWVRDDPRITEVVIVDDYSKIEIYESLQRMVLGFEKVKLYRNPFNIGCYHNKRRAVQACTNDWVILLDSDNKLGSDYMNAINTVYFEPNTLFAPDFARPHFDYTAFKNEVISRENVNSYLGLKNFDCMINTCNFLVNRAEYLRVFDTEQVEPWTADTLYFNYCWLKAGNHIKVVEGMQYEHLVHDGSHYKENVHKTGNFFNEVMAKLKAL